LSPRRSLALAVGRDLLVAVVICAVALVVSLTVQLRLTERTMRESSLERAARHVDRYLQIDPDGRARLPAQPGSSWASFGYPTLVFDRDGNLLLKRPLELDAMVVEALAKQLPAAGERSVRRDEIRFFRLPLGGQQIIGAVLRAGSGPDERSIEVFKDVGAPDVLIDDVVREFPLRSLSVLLPVFGLLLLAGGIIVWRRIRPIAEVATIAGSIGPNTLNLRLPERDLPKEVLPLVRSVNGALERLEAAAAGQREFLQRAAHHLRTPLTVLSARAGSLDDSAMAEQLRADVNEIARIISQLLELNEVDAVPGRDNAVADLGAVAEAVREGLAMRAARHRSRVELSEPEAPVLVHGDPNIIEVAVRNLVENALENSPEGAPVSLCVGSDGQIAVGDRGPGVADELHERIFEPFWSGDPHGVRPGLGLAIVRRVAGRHRGTIGVEARPGGGALFTMRFPLAPVAYDALDPAAIRRSLPASLIRPRLIAELDAAEPNPVIAARP
jgi:signal transduction histidine kinase